MPQNSHPRSAATPRIGVQPVIDLTLGTVEFRLPRGSHTFATHEPRVIEAALCRAIRPAQWEPSTSTLFVTMAGAGPARTREIGFSFAPDDGA